MGDEQVILKEIFGYDSFRPGQGELVDAILSGHDVLGIMPTGAGKSICYQVPALCMNGITLVVSPLTLALTTLCCFGYCWSRRFCNKCTQPCCRGMP